MCCFLKHSSIILITTLLNEVLSKTIPFDKDNSLINSINSEKAYKWYGNVAMITATEFIRASNYTGCSSISSAMNSYNCGNNNYLYNNKSSGYNGSFTAGNIGGVYGKKRIKNTPSSYII